MSASDSLYPFPREVRWCVVFRQGDDGLWRLYAERGTHHGASLELSEGKAKHLNWTFRLSQKATEWAWE